MINIISVDSTTKKTHQIFSNVLVFTEIDFYQIQTVPLKGQRSGLFCRLNSKVVYPVMPLTLSEITALISTVVPHHTKR